MPDFAVLHGVSHLATMFLMRLLGVVFLDCIVAAVAGNVDTFVAPASNGITVDAVSVAQNCDRVPAEHSVPAHKLCVNQLWSARVLRWQRSGSINGLSNSGRLTPPAARVRLPRDFFHAASAYPVRLHLALCVWQV
jgi:hypothetical protein